MPVQIYDAKLFTKAKEQCVVLSKNNVPQGLQGVDDVLKQNDKLKRGICGGMSLAWVLSFCHANAEATTVKTFKNYFDTLRYQGSYLMQNGAKVQDGLKAFKNSGTDHGLDQISGKKKMQEFSLDEYKYGMPDRFGIVLGLLHHGIAVGVSNGRYYIMDPNCGLFVYYAEKDFISDLNEQLLARRVRNNFNFDEKAFTYCFTKKDANKVYL